MNYIDIYIVSKNLATSILQVSIGYNSIDGLHNAYSIKQEKSLVQAQNKVALSQYLPTNSTLFLKNEKQKREKLKYVTPDNWTDAFKLIKLIWQTRQLA
jgi:hypothetical protein